MAIGEFQTGIASLDFFSWWMVAFRNTPQPVFTTTGGAGLFVDFTHCFLKAGSPVFGRAVRQSCVLFG
jgi:hypothetical protein